MGKKSNIRKINMTPKQANRTLQRLQTYANEMMGVLNAHQANPQEAMAATFAVAVRLAKQLRYGADQFLDEAESAFENLKKLPLDQTKLVVVEAEVRRPWGLYALIAAACSGWAAAVTAWFVL